MEGGEKEKSLYRLQVESDCWEVKVTWYVCEVCITLTGGSLNKQGRTRLCTDLGTSVE